VGGEDSTVRQLLSAVRLIFLRSLANHVWRQHHVWLRSAERQLFARSLANHVWRQPILLTPIGHILLPFAGPAADINQANNKPQVMKPVTIMATEFAKKNPQGTSAAHPTYMHVYMYDLINSLLADYNLSGAALRRSIWSVGQTFTPEDECDMHVAHAIV
jgi:hypothetical protein